MESRIPTSTNAESGYEADKFAELLMFAQRSILLDLSEDLNQFNVSYAQFFLLGYLTNEDFLTLSDVAGKMCHSIAAATGLVDRLEKLGYVKRLHAADDRRKQLIQVTPRGAELVSGLQEKFARWLGESKSPEVCDLLLLVRHDRDIESERQYPHLVFDKGDEFPIVGRVGFKGIHLIANHIAHGWSAEELVANYPHLTLGEVYSILGWFSDHREMATKHLKEGATEARARALESRHQQIASRLREQGILESEPA